MQHKHFLVLPLNFENLHYFATGWSCTNSQKLAKNAKTIKDKGQNDCNKKGEDSIEADGLRYTPLNPTTNRLSAMIEG